MVNETLREIKSYLDNMDVKKMEKLISLDRFELTSKPQIVYLASHTLTSKPFLLRNVTLLNNVALERMQEDTKLNNYEFSAACYCILYKKTELIIWGQVKVSQKEQPASNPAKKTSENVIYFQSTGDADEGDPKNAPLTDIITALESQAGVCESNLFTFKNFEGPVKKLEQTRPNRRWRRVFRISEL